MNDPPGARSPADFFNPFAVMFFAFAVDAAVEYRVRRITNQKAKILAVLVAIFHDAS